MITTDGVPNPTLGIIWNCSQVLALDKFNPQVAARLCGSFNTWRRYGASLQAPLMTMDDQ
jgi:aminopeptidase N